MVQSVELLLDQETESAVRTQWLRLRESDELHGGVPDPDNHRPHITLAVADEVFPRIEKELSRPGWFVPVTVRLGGLVVFPGRRSVLARLVVPSVELLTLQERVFAMMRPCPGSTSHTAPGTWTPHVTLARRLLPDQVGGAVRVLERIRDRTGSGDVVRRWDGTAHTAWAVGSSTDRASGSSGSSDPAQRDPGAE